MQRAKKIIQECLQNLASAPPRVFHAFEGLFSRFFEILNDNQELVEKSMPFLVKIHQLILEKRYTEAFLQLLTLVALWFSLHKRRQKSKR